MFPFALALEKHNEPVKPQEPKTKKIQLCTLLIQQFYHNYHTYSMSAGKLNYKIPLSKSVHEI